MFMWSDGPAFGIRASLDVNWCEEPIESSTAHKHHPRQHSLALLLGKDE